MRNTLFCYLIFLFTILLASGCRIAGVCTSDKATCERDENPKPSKFKPAGDGNKDCDSSAVLGKWVNAKDKNIMIKFTSDCKIDYAYCHTTGTFEKNAQMHGRSDVKFDASNLQRPAFCPTFDTSKPRKCSYSIATHEATGSTMLNNYLSFWCEDGTDLEKYLIYSYVYDGASE